MDLSLIKSQTMVQLNNLTKMERSLNQERLAGPSVLPFKMLQNGVRFQF